MMKLISQMSRKNPNRVEKINFVKNQTSNSKQKMVYCCGPNQEARRIQLCEKFAKKCLNNTNFPNPKSIPWR